MTDRKFVSSQPRLPAGGETTKHAVTEDNSTIVKAALRHSKTITADAGNDITDWPCDGLMFSGNTTAVVTLADDDPASDSVAIAFTGGVLYQNLQVRRLHSVTGGVTTKAFWTRKPALPTRRT